MNKRIFQLILAVSLLLFNSVILRAQEKDSQFDNFKEFFTLYPNKKAAAVDSTLYKSKLILAPVVSFAPETSLGLGVGAKYLFKFKGSGEETRTSNMPMTLRYTLKNQFVLFSGFEIFTNQEKWVIEGNFILKNFPRPFFGLGRESLEDDEEIFDSFQLLFEPIFLKELFFNHFFVGAGVRYNHIFDASPEENGLLERLAPEGFRGSTSSGAEFAVLYDSRDNILNARHGMFLEFTHGFYGKVLGGTQEFQLTRFDARYFFQPFKKRDDVIGLQAIGKFSHKDVPFSELALFGSGEILRGYIEGRYVDRNIMALQLEYRTNLIGRLGMVAFVAAGDVASRVSDFQVGNIRGSAGVGLRFLLDKEERLNIRFDWGVAKNTNNVYLNIAESF